MLPGQAGPRGSRPLDGERPAYAHLYGEAHPHTDATLDGLTASARRAGIDFSLVLPIATSPKPSRTINDFAAQADKHPGLRSFGSVHPGNPDWEEELNGGGARPAGHQAASRIPGLFCRRPRLRGRGAQGVCARPVGGFPRGG